MDNNRPAKKSKGLYKQLKKVLGFGSQSTPTPTPTPTLITAPTMSNEEARKLRQRYSHFRILVIGRANAGKTTLLKRVCNTVDDPVYEKIRPTNLRGLHNVHDEFKFENNPQFIFHDSPGFEAGGEEELISVMNFIQEKANAKDVKDQIHAIWFCFEPDVCRPLLSLEHKFFNEERPGNVPVVAIFTKFDDFIREIFERSKDEAENRKTALDKLEESFERPLRNFKYPPRSYVRFESIHEDEGNHQEQVGELIEQTTQSLDDMALKMLFVTVQKNNLKVCIEGAVDEGISGNSNTMEHLIYNAASWFIHFYFSHDYGDSTDRYDRLYYDRLYDRLLYYDHQVQMIRNSVEDRFNSPSLYALAAILICLEHSFWVTQKGFGFSESFPQSWKTYIDSRHYAVLDQVLDEYLRSEGHNDWLVMRYHPSEDERVELRNIILGNLLPRPS